MNPATVLRIYEYQRIGEASRYIFLGASGNFYDSIAPTTPILTVVGATDFAMVVLYNRCYISPHNGETGLSNEKVYVYDGSGTARAAAGTPPSGFTLGVAEGSSSGNDAIEEGTHLFAVAYETASGHITAPGLASGEVAVLAATGGKRADLSSIPVGPSWVTARHILVTKIIPEFSAGTEQYQEWYFLPDGRIGDNTTTVLNDVSFFDIALQDSADILLNQVSEIPAGVFLTTYASRLVSGGEAANKSTVRVSDSAYPESFSSLDGFFNVRPGDAGGGVTNGVEHRSFLYVCKDQRFYVTQDNGGAPSSWEVPSVDAGLGTGPHGISKVLDSEGHSRDQFLIAARSGLFQYLGAIAERELTWNIKGIWDRINDQYFHTVQVVVDPQRELIFVNVPLDSATAPSHVLMGDYSEALDPEGMKWSVWDFPEKPTSILARVNDTTKESFLVYGSSEGGVFAYDETARNDNSTKIEAFYTTHPWEIEDGSLAQIGGLRQKIRGYGSTSILLSNADGTITESYPGFSLSTTPGGDVLSRFDFQSERATVKVSLASIDHWFKVSRYVGFVQQLWLERPE